jgi:hypothetical protein
MMKATRRISRSIGCACTAAVLTGSALLIAPEPCSAQSTALLIGNSLYEEKCAEDLPSVPNDLVLMDEALGNAAYSVVSVENRSGLDMVTDVESNVPPLHKIYVVYYSGHGEPAVEGSPVGPDCTRMTPELLQGALGEAIDGTLLILDSCGSGTFAEAINALDDRICTITSTTGTDCAQKGVFTPCFAQGLMGAADANGNGEVTVAEAGAYAVAHCGDGNTTPTYDGGCPDVPIGMGPVALQPATWGRVKAGYR